MLPLSFTYLITVANSEWLLQEMEHALIKVPNLQERGKEPSTVTSTHITFRSVLKAHAKVPTEHN